METQALDAVSATVKTGTGKVLVEKRDGRVVDFDPINIISAVKSAFADLDKKIGPQEEQLIRDQGSLQRSRQDRRHPESR